MIRFIQWVFGLALLGAITVAVVLAWAVTTYSRDLPSLDGLNDFRFQVPLRIYTREHKLIGEFGAERREPLKFEELPPRMVQAILAAEDDRFYEHPGVDYQGLVRAAWVLVTTGEKAQGGSTITMQLARNFYLSNEKSYTRKFKEILLSLQMERELTKNQILTFYLNKIYLGHRAYGVGAASSVYYGRPISELTLPELAMIAGLPKAPSRYNPIADPDRARLRRNYVLRRMNELNFISVQELKQAQAAPITARLRRAPIDVEAYYVAEEARSQAYDLIGDAVYTDGYEVITTLSARRQTLAVHAVRKALLEFDARHGFQGAEDHFADIAATVDWAALPADRLAAQLDPLLESRDYVGELRPAIVLARDADALLAYATESGLQRIAKDDVAWPDMFRDDGGLVAGDLIRLQPEATEDGATTWKVAQIPAAQGALVALNPADGAVEAMVGGFDFFRSKFNRATQARRQPGSSFKPFLYSAALDNGLTAATVLNDAPVVFDDPALGGAWRPQNYTGKFYGPTRLRDGLVRSSNLVSIRVLDTIGIAAARRHAALFGLDPDRMPRDLSLALGSGTFSPLEMATAYAVFANGGYRVTPYMVSEIRKKDGDVLYRADPPRVCPECEAPAEEGFEPPVDKPAPRVLSAENAFIVDSFLQDVVRRGTGRRARQLGRSDLGGKTGTTNDQRDAWFCGFNADHVAVVWVGHDDLTPLGGHETGGRAALPMWMEYMGPALAGTPEAILPAPPGVVTVKINRETGQMARADDPHPIFEYFIEGRLPPAPESQAPVNQSSDQDNLVEDLF